MNAPHSTPPGGPDSATTPIGARPTEVVPDASPGLHRVQLDAYAGPLDLLLFLVKRHEIDLHDIPMAELVEQYLAHLRVIETIDVDQAGEFLVMAASLVEIKSRMILPATLRDDEAEETSQGAQPEPAVDPRFELVQQLLAYKRFKDVANTLEARAEDWGARFPASAKAAKVDPSGDDVDPEATDALPADLDLEDVNVLDLCSAFGRVMDSIGHLGDHAVTYDDTPISLHADDIADRLRRDGGPDRRLNLRVLFTGRNRGEMIGLFLATLELVRQRKVRVLRGEDSGDPGQLALELQPEDQWIDADRIEDAATPDWTDPQTGQVRYDWPDEQTRLRAERRANRRQTLGEGQAGSAGFDDSEEDDFDADGHEPAKHEESA